VLSRCENARDEPGARGRPPNNARQMSKTQPIEARDMAIVHRTFRTA
jgi:hypothetical protein